MKRVFFIVILASVIYLLLDRPAVTQPPGVLIADSPKQTTLNRASPFSYKDYRITPLARFKLDARVLARERYRLGREAELAPVDLALGWGPMSDGRVLEQIDISQSGRFYYWRVQQFPIPRRDIEIHSANMHLIPATTEIEERILAIRPGELIRLTGQLVRVEAEDGWHWASSLTREDTGNGACELIWVERLELI